jgi:ABC-type dipeptide/oligopeptide/nickel transport system permease component
MPTTYVIDKDGNSADASAVTLPSDRHFRDAWSLSGDVISEDLAIAKTMMKEEIRYVRKALLQSLDTDYMRALEASADTSSIVSSKQALRDAPATQAITDATTISELKAAWPSCCGTSPYED